MNPLVRIGLLVGLVLATKRGREWIVNETDLVAEDDGRLLVRGRTYQSFLPPEDRSRGDGFVVDPQTAARKAERPPFPTATGAELAPVVADNTLYVLTKDAQLTAWR